MRSLTSTRYSNLQHLHHLLPLTRSTVVHHGHLHLSHHPLFTTTQFLGNRKLTSDVAFSWNPFTLWSGWKSLGARLKSKKIEGNYSGEGLTLGGIIVYSPDKGIVYSYKEVTGSEIPSEEIIIAAAEALGHRVPDIASVSDGGVKPPPSTCTL